MKNYDPFQSPKHFKMMDLLKKFDKNFNATGKNYGKVGPDRTIDDVMKRRQDRWNFLLYRGDVVPGFFSITTSVGPSSASFLMPRKKARSVSALTTRAWDGAISLRRCI